MISLLDKLLIEAENEGIEIIEHAFTSNKLKGLYVDGVITLNTIAINSYIEKTCVLAEEMGHHLTSFGNILDQKCIVKRKQEKRARNWAYYKLVPLEAFIYAFETGVRNRYEFADTVGVTEEFLDFSIARYKEKFGLFTELNETYTIYFDPLGVLKAI
ncbi:ImmA/IrrE family metallo-endopeptidase [Paenibacillus lautus]|uniref:ImmA/IrrE family metallo-endopeptidase n=1 Tax=Paenibacillus lautus TaxID=1401 RepID=UPI0035B4FED2